MGSLRRSLGCEKKAGQGRRSGKGAVVCPRLTAASAGGLLYRLSLQYTFRSMT